MSIINKEKAISEIVKTANAADNWPDLCSKALDKIAEIAFADAGFLMIAEGNLLTLEVVRGLSPSIWKKPPLKIGEDLPGKVAKSGKFLVVDNLNTQSKTSLLYNSRYSKAIILPLTAYGELLGVIALFSIDRDAFKKTDDPEELCEVIAITLSSFRNIQLFRSVQKYQKQIKILTESLKALSHSLGFSEMLYATLAIAASFSNSQKSAFAKYNKKENTLVIEAPTFGLSTEQTESLKVNHDEKIGGTAFCRGTYQVMNRLDDEHQKYLKKAGLDDIKSILALPLKSRSQTIGVMYLFSEKEDNFREDDVKILEKIGSVLSTSILHSEITDHAQAEKNKTEAILEASRENILAIDRHKNIIFANKILENLLAVKKEAIVGRPITEILRFGAEEDEIRKDFDHFIDKTLNEEKKTNISPKISFKTQKNKNISAEINAVPLKDKTGKIMGLLLNIKDQSRELSLREMQNTLVAITAHELRNPITGVKGYLELILSGETGKINVQTKETLEEAKRVTDHLSHLVDDILYVSQIEEETITIRERKFNLTELVFQVLHSFRNYALEKKLSLSHNLKKPIFVKADPEKTKEILTNLVDNAIKYTSKGQIKVALSEVGNFIEASITDSGIGLMPDQIKNLFSKFYRIITPETKNIAGTGLGLWITKNLVEKQGGKVAVISAKGQGSTFKFTLPKSI